MTDTIRFGILGTGFIARQFAGDLQHVVGAKLVAVGSRSQETADDFGKTFDIPNCHASYEALATDPRVDVVYIATPHPFHCPNTLMCLDAGKAVICEKPFALNETEAREMIDAASKHDLFLMEGMWTYCFPAMRKIKELIVSGTIGEPRMLTGAFCWRSEWDESTAVLNRKLGGGALLDVGVYPISVAHFVFDCAPETILASAHIGVTGVDEQNGIVMTYPGGSMAVMASAVRTTMPEELVISGTDAQIRIPEPFYRPNRIEIIRENETEQLDFAYPGTGMQYEAQEVVDCLRAGKRESDLITQEGSLAVMRTMDRIRDQWGLRYPGE
jgi:predicted dehydrogenase